MLLFGEDNMQSSYPEGHFKMIVQIFRIFAKKKVQELCFVLSPVSCAGDIGLHVGILFGVCQGDWATRVETNRR